MYLHVHDTHTTLLSASDAAPIKFSCNIYHLKRRWFFQTHANLPSLTAIARLDDFEHLGLISRLRETANETVSDPNAVGFAGNNKCQLKITSTTADRRVLTEVQPCPHGRVHPQEPLVYPRAFFAPEVHVVALLRVGLSTNPAAFALEIATVQGEGRSKVSYRA